MEDFTITGQPEHHPRTIHANARGDEGRPEVGPFAAPAPSATQVVIFRFLTNRTHLSGPLVSDIPQASDALFEGAPTAGLPRYRAEAPEATCICISPWSARWQLEVSRVRTRWFRGSLVLRRHLSSRAGSLEATANPLSSFSFSFHFSPAHQPPASFSPAHISVHPISPRWATLRDVIALRRGGADKRTKRN